MFYENSGMHQENEAAYYEDRQILKDDFRRANFVLQEMDAVGKNVMDFGCGYAGFLKLIQSYTAKAVGVELEKRARVYATELGIEVYDSLQKIKDGFDIITLFHVIEHLIDPMKYLVEIKELMNEGGRILIETPNIEDALISRFHSESFKNFTFWGCHVFLYSQKALEMLLKKCGYRVEWSRQIQRYPLSNHLYWLSEKKPGGHEIWRDMSTDVMDKAYEGILAQKGICDTLLICASVKK